MNYFRDVLLAAGVTAALVGWAPVASGHGRFPQAGQIVLDPNDATRIFVRTTYGATQTSDAGDTWYWLCPDSIGVNADKEDPPVVIMDDGSLVLGTFGGLSVSHDFGCDFALEGGDLDGRFFVDAQPRAGDASAVALSSNGQAAFEFAVDLWETTDNAASWERLGTSPPVDFLAVSLGVAESDETRLYLTGRDGVDDSSISGVLFRSDDSGATWQRLPIPNAVPTMTGMQILPYIGAVDPADESSVYVGVITTEGDNVVTHFELLHSSDGAETWTSIFEADDGVSGVALSPDGSTIAVGGLEQGLWTAPTATFAFTKVSEVRIGCLTWEDSGIYACADQFVDGYVVGKSTDDGKTFSGLAELGSPCGPPDCPGGTSTNDICVARWPQEMTELDAPGCDGAGGAASTGSGESSGSCGCRVVAPEPASGHSSRPGGLLVVMAGLGAAAMRRRKRK